MIRCQIDGCNRKLNRGVKHGLCTIHRNEQKKLYCKVDGCKNVVKIAKDMLCSKHLAHLDRYGKILRRTTHTPNEFVMQNI
jgi:hypothetical protein